MWKKVKEIGRVEHEFLRYHSYAYYLYLRTSVGLRSLTRTVEETAADHRCSNILVSTISS